MFELIRANKRRSMVLVIVMLFLLMALGFAIGSALVPSLAQSEFHEDSFRPGFAFNPTGGLIGMGVAFCIWFVQVIIAYSQGDRILLSVSRARPIEKQDHPQLFNVVEEMTIAAQLPKMPKVYLIDDMAMNAFATGRTPENAAVAVTAGLLGRLNRDELQGVVAHEISHIVNRDVMFMTMVGIMLGSIVMIAEVFLRGLFYSSVGGRRYRSSSKRGGGQGIMMVVAIVLAILVPILAQFIYFACSRRREYLADASAAVYTRYPEGLASALAAISGDTLPLQTANRATAPMYIAEPRAKGEGMALNLSGTHPPIHERIKILRSMAGGASYQHYQSAWAKAHGKGSSGLPKSAFALPAAPIRKAHPEVARESAAPKDPRQQMREAGDLLRKVNQFLFLPCVCGMRIKLPPEFKKEQVKCPRCKRTLQVPVAQVAVAGAIGTMMTQQAGSAPAAEAAAPKGPLPPLEITRRGQDWMSFKCSCGAVKNLAPSCIATETKCTKCGREIRIKYAG